jgi:hypothetical protein
VRCGCRGYHISNTAIAIANSDRNLKPLSVSYDTYCIEIRNWTQSIRISSVYLYWTWSHIESLFDMLNPDLLWKISVHSNESLPKFSVVNHFFPSQFCVVSRFSFVIWFMTLILNYFWRSCVIYRLVIFLLENNHVFATINYKIQFTIWKIVLPIHDMHLDLTTMSMTTIEEKNLILKNWILCVYNTRTFTLTEFGWNLLL